MKSIKAVAFFISVLLLTHSVPATNLPPLIPTNAIPAQTVPLIPAVFTPIITNVVVAPQTPSSLSPKDFFPFFTTLLGTFLGAYLAYGATLKKERREEEDRIQRKREEKEEQQFSTISQTQFILLHQKTRVQTVLRTLNRLQKDPKRHLLLPRFVNANIEIHIPFESLTFLLNEEDLDTLDQIRFANNAYLNLQACIEHHRELREKIAEKYPPQNINLATGESDFAKMEPHDELHLKGVVNRLYELAGEAFKCFNRPYDQLGEYVTKKLKRPTLKIKQQPD